MFPTYFPQLEQPPPLSWPRFANRFVHRLFRLLVSSIIRPYVRPSVSPSVCTSVRLSVRQPPCLFVDQLKTIMHLSVSLYVCLSARLSVCLSVSLFVCLSVQLICQCANLSVSVWLYGSSINTAGRHDKTPFAPYFCRCSPTGLQRQSLSVWNSPPVKRRSAGGLSPTANGGGRDRCGCR